ncbi:MAG: hypothetical protein GF397_04710 [Elusimicrobia bacterium]|nr:hypothetical protein [Elusimicrobiota bacterium]
MRSIIEYLSQAEFRDNILRDLGIELVHDYSVLTLEIARLLCTFSGRPEDFLYVEELAFALIDTGHFSEVDDILLWMGDLITLTTPFPAGRLNRIVKALRKKGYLSKASPELMVMLDNILSHRGIFTAQESRLIRQAM